MGGPASAQKCQAEGICGINLNTSAWCIPMRLGDVITCFPIIHMQTDVHMAFHTTRFETVEMYCGLCGSSLYIWNQMSLTMDGCTQRDS